MNLNRLLYAGAFVALLSLGLANAQTVNKALQLSQDASGAFGVDTNNNVYFPGHVLTTGPGSPALGTGLSTATLTGTDTAGHIVGLAASSAGSITFNQAYVNAPYCLLMSQNPATSPIAYNAVATGINVTTWTGALSANYICSGSK